MELCSNELQQDRALLRELFIIAFYKVFEKILKQIWMGRPTNKDDFWYYSEIKPLSDALLWYMIHGK